MFMFGMMFFRYFAIICMILIVTGKVEEKTLTIGSVIGFLMYMQMLTSKVGEMLGQINQLVQIKASAFGIAAIISAPTTV